MFIVFLVLKHKVNEYLGNQHLALTNLFILSYFLQFYSNNKMIFVQFQKRMYELMCFLISLEEIHYQEFIVYNFHWLFQLCVLGVWCFYSLFKWSHNIKSIEQITIWFTILFFKCTCFSTFSSSWFILICTFSPKVYFGNNFSLFHIILIVYPYGFKTT